MQTIEFYRRDADRKAPRTVVKNVVGIRPVEDFVDEYILSDGNAFLLDAREYQIVLYETRETPQARYDSKNTVQISLKLNRKTDGDIIAMLDKQPNKQGYIKAVLREELTAE